jgi:hypothetical protein
MRPSRPGSKCDSFRAIPVANQPNLSAFPLCRLPTHRVASSLSRRSPISEAGAPRCAYS